MKASNASGDAGRPEPGDNFRQGDPDSPVLETWRLILRTLALVPVLLGITALAVYLDLPLEDMAIGSARRGGLLGVFIFVWFVDTFTVPATLDLVFPFTVHWSPVPLLIVMSGASVLGGTCGYWIGRGLGRLRFVRRTIAGYYARNVKLITRYGAWAVALAAVTPLPFSTVSWIAGMVRLPYDRYLRAASLRIPRVVAYWAIVHLGLELFF